MKLVMAVLFAGLSVQSFDAQSEIKVLHHKLAIAEEKTLVLGQAAMELAQMAGEISELPDLDLRVQKIMWEHLNKAKRYQEDGLVKIEEMQNEEEK